MCGVQNLAAMNYIHYIRYLSFQNESPWNPKALQAKLNTYYSNRSQNDWNRPPVTYPRVAMTARRMRRDQFVRVRVGCGRVLTKETRQRGKRPNATWNWRRNSVGRKFPTVQSPLLPSFTCHCNNKNNAN